VSLKHVAGQGECITSIAAMYGFQDYRIVYDHPENAAFKAKRPDPNVIYPGDVLAIPDPRSKHVSCATGKEHRFRLNVGRRLLRIALKDHENRPLASVDYVLSIEGTEIAAKTDSDGLLEQAVPVRATEGVVNLPRYGLSLKIQIGHLDPVHDDDGDAPIHSGIRARLVNLGYLSGRDGDDATTRAVAAFQRNALGRDAPDGIADRETRAALLAQHGC
jgi:hypothetical protein